ncbi:UDP-4-amino-4,6-dideoxy-N-acetyl-beta-L-altrosamine transaminase [Arthrobacter pigmenti]|uniref:UDP-4-amino-4, 6-dideoxy-N-acetyl-beta-L-altrosamine transaminase n=1 Tax=Arthrobacter pigmenti TaxID=271432 RepID=A0A846RUA7_9MICC|nr:UDP-4-amino-4,6-dideoxy-N-acetyl-beta-L-altrosamine transaminase [Arthrobacter pigmenti]NJC22626.1 UDP-4-amino-4,6-dideoxy-N-acetyl-beta-L-altrosamine transaminase [Arthrobacter pigmenti]
MLPYGRQDIRTEDIDAVVAVLQSDFLTQGPVVPAFEGAVAKKVGAQHGVATNSATSALHVACLALGLGPGDSLWTTPNTFVASANCAIYCGAKVDFVDIDPYTYNMSVVALEQKLRSAAACGDLPRILVLVHFAGEPCDLEAIASLATQYGVRIIEDASHAVGGKYRDHYIGSGRYSDITIFSFHPVKIITTAEGGLALTGDAGLADRMRLYRSHGVTRDPGLMESESAGAWYYEQVALGFNYRMTELQAALGLAQLDRLDDYVARRHALADRYDELLSSVPVVTPTRGHDRYSALHLYPVCLKSPDVRETVFNGLRSRGVGVNVHYIPVHTQPFYQARGFQWGDFPAAESYYRRTISLPLFPAMTDDDLATVVGALEETLESV